MSCARDDGVIHEEKWKQKANLSRIRLLQQKFLSHMTEALRLHQFLLSLVADSPPYPNFFEIRVRTSYPLERLSVRLFSATESYEDVGTARVYSHAIWRSMLWQHIKLHASGLVLLHRWLCFVLKVYIHFYFT